MKPKFFKKAKLGARPKFEAMQAKIWGQASFEAKREARPGQVLEYATPHNQSYYIPEADNYTAE